MSRGLACLQAILGPAAASATTGTGSPGPPKEQSIREGKHSLTRALQKAKPSLAGSKHKLTTDHDSLYDDDDASSTSTLLTEDHNSPKTSTKRTKMHHHHSNTADWLRAAVLAVLPSSSLPSHWIPLDRLFPNPDHFSLSALRTTLFSFPPSSFRLCCVSSAISTKKKKQCNCPVEANALPNPSHFVLYVHCGTCFCSSSPVPFLPIATSSSASASSSSSSSSSVRVVPPNCKCHTPLPPTVGESLALTSVSDDPLCTLYCSRFLHPSILTNPQQTTSALDALAKADAALTAAVAQSAVPILTPTLTTSDSVQKLNNLGIDPKLIASFVDAERTNAALQTVKDKAQKEMDDHEYHNFRTWAKAFMVGSRTALSLQDIVDAYVQIGGVETTPQIIDTLPKWLVRANDLFVPMVLSSLKTVVYFYKSSS